MLGLWACTSGAPAEVDTSPRPAHEESVDTEIEHVGDPIDTGWDPLELCLNEFMPDNQSVIVEAVGTTPDWIELHNPGDEPVSLDGWVLTDEGDGSGSELDRRLVVDAGGFLVLYADGVPAAGSDHLDFGLAAEGGEVGLYAPDGRGQVVLYGAVESDFSVARVPDCCTGPGCLAHDFRGSPGALNDPPEPVEIEVITAGSVWSWWDAGEPEGDWTSALYDATAWSTGLGPLGFGDAHQVTVVDGGAADARTPAIYFRRTFTGPSEPVALAFGLQIDDGAVAWLNGEEAVRVNLPDGDITHGTLASAARGDADETTYFAYTIDPELLLVGENVLAVEVHQATATSSDLSFDATVTVSIYD